MSTSRPPVSGFETRGRLSRPPIASVALVLLPIMLVGLVAIARANLVSQRPTLVGLTVGAEEASPEQLTATAADALEAATAEGGAGYRFEIVQRAAIHFADGSDPHVLGTYLEDGHAVPGGYYAEVRRGPDDPQAEVDFDAGTVELRALVRDGLTWRDDSDGWYETTEPPGLGLDPTTAGLLPALLRESTDIVDVTDDRDSQEPPAPSDHGAAEPTATEAGAPTSTDDAVDPTPSALGAARSMAATAKVADLPGIIAVDLADSTELLEPVVFDFDADGRLIGLTVVARNTRLEADELRVTTTIRFTYPIAAPDLPDPETNLAPPDAPIGEAP